MMESFIITRSGFSFRCDIGYTDVTYHRMYEISIRLLAKGSLTQTKLQNIVLEVNDRVIFSRNLKQLNTEVGEIVYGYNHISFGGTDTIKLGFSIGTQQTNTSDERQFDTPHFHGYSSKNSYNINDSQHQHIQYEECIHQDCGTCDAPRINITESNWEDHVYDIIESETEESRTCKCVCGEKKTISLLEYSRFRGPKRLSAKMIMLSDGRSLQDYIDAQS